MTEHLHGILTFLTSKIGGIIGFLSGLLVVTTANTDIPVDVLHFVLFSIGPVQFPVQSMLTLVGAITTSIFFIAQMWALARGRKTEQKLANELRELQNEVHEMQESE